MAKIKKNGKRLKRVILNTLVEEVKEHPHVTAAIIISLLFGVLTGYLSLSTITSFITFGWLGI